MVRRCRMPSTFREPGLALMFRFGEPMGESDYTAGLPTSKSKAKKKATRRRKVRRRKSKQSDAPEPQPPQPQSVSFGRKAN